MKVLVVLVAVLVAASGMPAYPDSPRPPSRNRGRTDCSGFVGFTGMGTSRVHATGLISYREVPFKRNISFENETGHFTVRCPGYYLISFAAYGNSANTRVILKKRSIKTNAWTDVASAGGSNSGGGSNQVVISMAENEEGGVFLAAGNIGTANDRQAPSTTFTAVKL